MRDLTFWGLDHFQIDSYHRSRENKSVRVFRYFTPVRKEFCKLESNPAQIAITAKVSKFKILRQVFFFGKIMFL